MIRVLTLEDLAQVAEAWPRNLKSPTTGELGVDVTGPGDWFESIAGSYGTVCWSCGAAIRFPERQMNLRTAPGGSLAHCQRCYAQPSLPGVSNENLYTSFR